MRTFEWWATFSSLLGLSLSSGLAGPGRCLPAGEGWSYLHWIIDIPGVQQYKGETSVRAGDDGESNDENFFFIGIDRLKAVKDTITELQVCFGSTSHCEQSFCVTINTNMFRSDQNWNCANTLLGESHTFAGLLTYLSGACTKTDDISSHVMLLSCEGTLDTCIGSSSVPWSCVHYDGRLSSFTGVSRVDDFGVHSGGKIHTWSSGLTIFPHLNTQYEIGIWGDGTSPYCEIDMFFVRVKAAALCPVDASTLGNNVEAGNCLRFLAEGESCEVVCTSGYTNEGGSTFTCNGGELIKPEGFSCIANPCDLSSILKGDPYSTECGDLVTDSECNQTCANGYGPSSNSAHNAGVYTCPLGELTGKSLECIDIDECVDPGDVCLDMDGCQNFAGHYTCTCPMFYTGDNVETACNEECPEHYISVVGNVPCVCPLNFTSCGWDEETGTWMVPELVPEISLAPLTSTVTASAIMLALVSN